MTAPDLKAKPELFKMIDPKQKHKEPRELSVCAERVLDARVQTVPNMKEHHAKQKNNVEDIGIRSVNNVSEETEIVKEIAKQ
eukprot:14689693-Ditylum_brightwellii.AAC.1